MSAAKTSRDDDELELERRLLHCLLLEHDGLNIEDVASELGTDRFTAESLLNDEQRAGVVDLRIEDSVYVSLRKTTPGPSASVREALQATRRRRAASARKRRGLLIGIPVALLALAGLGFGVSRLPPASPAANPHASQTAAEEPSPRAPTAVTESQPAQPRATTSSAPLEERVEARVVAERKRQWTADLADREKRITTLTNDAESSGCAAKWTAGATCYVSHRRMSKTEFDEERAALASEAAQLRARLADSP